MKAMLKKACEVVASCGVPTHVPLGTVLGSLLVFPVLSTIRLFEGYLPDATMWFFLVFGLISLVALYVTTLTPDVPHVFVIDKIWGLLLAFESISFAVKMVIVGFCSFHLIRVIFPFLCRRLCNIDIYRYGGLSGVLLPSMIAGLCVNGLLHLVQWAAR